MRLTSSSLLLFAAVIGCTSQPAVVNITLAENNGPDMSVLVIASTGTPGITVTPTAGLKTTTTGGTAHFSVVLNAPPTQDVIIGLVSSDVTQGTVSPSSLTFTSNDWNVSRGVTVTGVDDMVVNGDHPYSIRTLPAKSLDPGYSGLNGADVSVTNVEEDVPGFNVTPTTLTVTPGGATATFTIGLKTTPTAPVTVGLTSSNPAVGTVSMPNVVLSTTAPQTVTVTGIDDLVVDGDQTFNIVTAAATSTDPVYNALDPADVIVTSKEVDVAGIVVTPTSGLSTTENGGTAQFSVSLKSKPTTTVTIPVVSSNTSHGTVVSPLTFTPANYGAHTVTITGQDDHAVTGNVGYTINVGPATSMDTVYNNMTASSVSVTSIDGSVAGFVVSPTSGLVTTEWGDSATFTISLNTVPSAPVVVTFTTNAPAYSSVSPTSWQLDNTNWNVAKTITVTGKQDTVVDNANPAVFTNAYTIVTSSSSTDVNYKNLDPSDVSVTSTDDDRNIYGGDGGPSGTAPAGMLWCAPGPANCVANLSTTITVGGTVNFFISAAGNSHGVFSTLATPRFPTGPLLTGTPGGVSNFTLTAGSAFLVQGPGTSNPYECFIHGTPMQGSITVNPTPP